VALRAGRGSACSSRSTVWRSAAGVVSDGNTGALLAVAKLMLRTLPGIHRPAIAGFFPTLRGESVMLDLGANVECDADNLVQFAIMGNVFARTVLGVLHPTVGILNVGSEELKGHEAVREASAVLRNTPMPGSFHGFVEGDDIAKGTVDVVVTDGFTGNIALKTSRARPSSTPGSCANRSAPRSWHGSAICWRARRSTACARAWTRAATTAPSSSASTASS
jgi:glycerol-3-phosphate acyltransferase PlsX